MFLAIRTILMHLTAEASAKARLEVGIALAHRFSAHLDIVFNVRPAHIPAASAGRGAYVHYMTEAINNAHQMAGEIAHGIDTCCKGLSWSWGVVNEEHSIPLKARANTSDLLILPSAPMTYFEDHFRWHLADCMAVDSACPTLVLPEGYVCSGDMGRHILLPWRDCRETARAIKDAMPFLEQAEKVTLLTVSRKMETPPDVQGISDFLVRHGVDVDVRHVAFRWRNAGRAIMAFAEDNGCDLVVMGAYSTSRTWQVLFGGATRYIIRHLSLPVIMSH
ncbi:MAG: hypothetical protein A2018_04675 [Alphaproteobacteria bacterium GWF2_58_20]|nr:MAG: hypothetical protein A2018_04675 [Alphaproteobacteria bacterium GWF2_58_20]